MAKKAELRRRNERTNSYKERQREAKGPLFAKIRPVGCHPQNIRPKRSDDSLGVVGYFILIPVARVASVCFVEKKRKKESFTIALSFKRFLRPICSTTLLSHYRVCWTLFNFPNSKVRSMVCIRVIQRILTTLAINLYNYLSITKFNRAFVKSPGRS